MSQERTLCQLAVDAVTREALSAALSRKIERKRGQERQSNDAASGKSLLVTLQGFIAERARSNPHPKLVCCTAHAVRQTRDTRG